MPLLQFLISKAKMQDNFYLAGYESGVSIALEVAGILEDYGLTGTVFCVGNTPGDFQKKVEQILSNYPTDEHLQNAVARHMYMLMTENDEGIEKALKNASSWSEKIEICVRQLLGRVAHSAQYARNLIEAAYTRLVQAKTCKIQPRELKSKVILLRAAEFCSDVSSVAELQRYSQRPIIVHELKESLAHATKDLRCSAKINHHLGPDLLKVFDEKNHCEIYLLNADQFMVNNLESQVDI